MDVLPFKRDMVVPTVAAGGSCDMGASALLGSEACRARLEAILAVVAPGKAQGWAALLIHELGGFRAVVGAPASKIERIIGAAPKVTALLSAINEGMAHALAQRLAARPVISNSLALSEYLRFSLGGSRIEEVRALYLNVRNFLIRDDLVAQGTLNQVTVYPRQIVKRALEIDASSIILVHNHPSGNLTPSAQDQALTRALASAAMALDIKLHDHMIVGRQGVVSLREQGFL